MKFRSVSPFPKPNQSGGLEGRGLRDGDKITGPPLHAAARQDPDRREGAGSWCMWLSHAHAGKCAETAGARLRPLAWTEFATRRSPRRHRRVPLMRCSGCGTSSTSPWRPTSRRGCCRRCTPASKGRSAAPPMRSSEACRGPSLQTLAAATARTLGSPSPCTRPGRLFTLPHSCPQQQAPRPLDHVCVCTSPLLSPCTD